MKENVICGHLIPAGTGLREYDSLVVTSSDDADAVNDYRSRPVDVEAVEVTND